VKASGYTDRRLHPRPCPLYPRTPGVRITVAGALVTLPGECDRYYSPGL
jgi:hypothetical protein